MRIPVVAGNWKMNVLPSEAGELATAIKDAVAGLTEVEVIVCPPATSIAPVCAALGVANVAVGGQNCYTKASGAFTGELSPQMLQDAGCTWVIIGHSERRQYFAETDAFLNEKLRFALSSGMKAMFCIGETLEEREAGQMNEVLRRQALEGLAGLSESDFANVVLAYEPVWAIGTGVTASPQQAQDAHAYVRALLTEGFGETVAQATRIQYGGSVKADNAAELMAQPDVDGALVGGASLQADSFAAIVKAAV